MPQRVDRLLDQIRTAPEGIVGDRLLASMLRPALQEFDGLSSNEAELVRGHVLAAFEHRRLDAEVINVAKEELRTSLNPTVLAGAALALRALQADDPECRTLLTGASQRLFGRDERVSFAARVGDASSVRTASDEIASTLKQWPAQLSPCCSGPIGTVTAAEPRTQTLCRHTLGRVFIEDQAGQRSPVADLLRDRTSLIAFFYTRCMNPAKCSQTIYDLAELARLAFAEPLASQLNIVAVSYDPDFDEPARLHAFGYDRRFPFAGQARLARCVTGWDAMRRQFDLQVGYGATTVNLHSRELFMVTSDWRSLGIDSEQLKRPDHLLDRLIRASSSHAAADEAI